MFVGAIVVGCIVVISVLLYELLKSNKREISLMLVVEHYEKMTDEIINLLVEGENSDEKKTKFETGQKVCTRRVADKIRKDRSFYEFVMSSLSKYMQCDWGNMCKDDAYLNDEAVENGCDRIFAEYEMLNTGIRIWIITESDRSVTTILFPSEYGKKG